MITVSIVSHGQDDLVDLLLSDIGRVCGPDASAIRVTRNTRVPEPRPFVADRPLVTIQNEIAKGFGTNHNAAFRNCTTPYFAILNPDLRLHADPFPALLQRLESVTRGSAGLVRGLVAPSIVGPDGHAEDAARELITPWRLLRRRLDGARAPATRPDWLAGMFLLVRSDAFRDVCGFDERFFMYCEDSDLCARLRLRGWDFDVVDDVRVVHDARRASRDSLRHLRWHVTSLFRLWLSPAFWRYRRLLQSIPR